jgi:hypothetical protein
VFSRLGVYLRLPGVDVERFSEAMQGSGLLGYIDTLSGAEVCCQVLEQQTVQHVTCTLPIGQSIRSYHA